MQQLNPTWNCLSLSTFTADTTMTWIAQYYFCFCCCLFPCLLTCFKIEPYYIYRPGCLWTHYVVQAGFELLSPQHAGNRQPPPHPEPHILCFTKRFSWAGDVGNERVLVYHAQCELVLSTSEGTVGKRVSSDFLYYVCPSLRDQNKMALDSNESSSFTT